MDAAATGIVNEIVAGIILAGGGLGTLFLLWRLYKVGAGAALQAAASAVERADAAESREKKQRLRAEEAESKVGGLESQLARVTVENEDLKRDLSYHWQRADAAEETVEAQSVRIEGLIEALRQERIR